MTSSLVASAVGVDAGWRDGMPDVCARYSLRELLIQVEENHERILSVLAMQGGLLRELQAALSHRRGATIVHKRRRITSASERKMLTAVYDIDPHPDSKTRMHLARQSGMSVEQVSMWFTNRRKRSSVRSER